MNQQWLFSEAQQKPDLSQWYTPPKLAQRVVDWACSNRFFWQGPPQLVVEPAAGTGALVKPLLDRGAAVVAYDIDPENVAILRELAPEPQLYAHCADFLSDRPSHIPPETRYSRQPMCGWVEPRTHADLVVMNPPFENNQDCKFVMEAFEVAPLVVAILRGVIEHGSARWRIMWRWVDVTSKVNLCERPKFGGEHQPKQDFVVMALKKREVPRKRGEAVSAGLIEWW